LDAQLVKAGVDRARIADVDRCTVCDNANWFSYRAQGGVCGRHSALCVAL
jgi:copper oxidase (laccase) domain-containing protein